MSEEPVEERWPIGDRIKTALAAEGRSQTSTEAHLVAGGVLSKGQLSSLISGRRGRKYVSLEILGAIADLLHVNFEWLARGIGPMRRGGRGTTPAEEAIVFARQNGAREDAIQAAWARNKDREGDMGTWDWVRAIDAEAVRLATTGAPRPEVVHKKQAAIRATKKKLAAQPEQRSNPPPAPKSVRGHQPKAKIA